jgi:hypothetical protein
MSLAKSVPKGLKSRKCKRTKLCEPPPISYIPEKDKVQEEVTRLRNLQIKTSLEKDATLNFPVWHKNGTKEAFLMHETAVLDVIKKRGHFKDYKEAERAYEEAKKAVEMAKEGVALLNSNSMSRGKKNCKKKVLAKAKEATMEAAKEAANGIILDFKDKMVTADEVKLPMQNINYLQGSSTLSALKLNHSLVMEPQSTQEATKRVTRILDTKYKKADLQSIVIDNYKHLSADQQKKLLQLLKNWESLFDGALGDWKTKPVSFQLKEGASPYHGGAFPVPKIHKETIIKEGERLCKLGVLEMQSASEWASPSFIIPKKDKTVCFLSDFREVNKRLVRKPFPIPKISTVLQEIEGFSYATALDLNMSYYTIRLDPDASKICTIIFPWGKYSYKKLPMGIAGSPDIFQGKMLELMESMEYVRDYLDDLLCISKLSLEDHLEKLEEVLRQLCDTGLNVNAAKSTFCALKI